MKIAAITDIGSCRQENQDNYCAQQLAGGTACGQLRREDAQGK